MSRARHESKGGERYKTVGPEKLDDEMKPKAYNAQGSDVEEEAEEGHGETEKRAKRKHGGRTMKEEHHVEGHHGKKRLDRPGRKRGGAVGSNLHPLTTAAKVTDAEGHKTDDGDAEDD